MMRPPAVAVLGVGAVLSMLAWPSTSEARAFRYPPGRPSPRTTWRELVRSSTALRLGLDNTPPPSVWAALRGVARSILQPLRAAVGDQVQVTSGYRSVAVNRAVGGVANSRHLQGEALDLVADSLNPTELAAVVVNLGLPVHRMLIYGGPEAHLHVELADGR